jgi:hypothetical protein
MRISLTAVIISATLTMPVIAEQNIYQLKKQEKAGTFAVTKSSSTIELSSNKIYDKYIISVSGDGGFSYKIESNTPTLNIHDIKLPYDGKYNYEVKAVQHVAEVRDTLNNGRAKDAIGKISIIDVQSGQFTTQFGEMKVVKEIEEPRINEMPLKLVKGDE